MHICNVPLPQENEGVESSVDYVCVFLFRPRNHVMFLSGVSCYGVAIRYLNGMRESVTDLSHNNRDVTWRLEKWTVLLQM